MNKVDLAIIQKPVAVQYECPHCESEFEIEYEELCDKLGEVCDWSFEKFDCPKCGEQLEVDSIEWM